MVNDKELSLLRQVFAEIIIGYSEAQFKDELVEKLYFKHPNFLDSAREDKNYELLWTKGLEAGLTSEEDKLKDLIKAGLWNQIREDELITIKTIVDSIRKGLAADNLIAPAQIKEQQIELTSNLDRLKIIEDERAGLLGMTLENYVNNEIYINVILYNIYLDNNFTKLKFNDIEDIEPEELNEIYSIYNKLNEKFSLINIKKIIVSDFFYSRFDLARGRVENFFDKKIINLTNYQYLLSYFASQYYNVLNNASDIPPNLRQDYDKLMSWVRDNQKQKKEAVEENPVTPAQSLLEEAKKAGGKLDKTQMAKLFNQTK